MKKLIDTDTLSTKSSNEWEYDEGNEILIPRNAGGSIDITASDCIISNSTWDYGIKGPAFNVKVPEGSFNSSEYGTYQTLGICFNIDKDEFEKLGTDMDYISFWIGDKEKKNGKLIEIGSDEIAITEFNDGIEGKYSSWHPNRQQYLDTVAITDNQCSIAYSDVDISNVSTIQFGFHKKATEGNLHGAYLIPGIFLQSGDSMTMPIILPSGTETTVTVTRISNGITLKFGTTDSDYQFVGAQLFF